MLVKNVSELALAIANEIKKEYLSYDFVDFSEFKEVTDFRTSDMKDRLYNVCHYDVKGAFLLLKI